MGDIRASQLARIGPLEFLTGQLLWGPAVLLAGAGLVGLFRSAMVRSFSPASWSIVVAFAQPMAAEGRACYAAPRHPTMCTTGAHFCERADHGVPGQMMRAGGVAVLLAFLLVGFPLGLPVLPPLEM